MKKLGILLPLALGICLRLVANVSADGNRVIAESDQGAVLYKMIACDGSMTSATACHAQEQERLTRRIRVHWLAAAAKKHSVSLTPAEAADVEAKTAEQSSHIQAAAERFHTLAIAALRVRRGESRDAVLADLSKSSIADRDLDWELQHVPTLAVAERTASKDFVAEGQQAARDFYNRAYLVKHLHDIVNKRAEAGHVSFAIAEEEFWSEVARDTHTRIVDPAYSMPERKGLLVNP